MITVRQLAIVALAGLGAAPGPARADGSIAKSEDGHTGLSYNFRDPRAADQRAIRECEGRCRIVLRYRKACAAVAVGRSGGGGWAARDTQGLADRDAMEQCETQGNGSCRVLQRGCDGR